jgi:hypothetical protein
MGLRRAPRIELVHGVVSPLLWWVPGRAARIVLPADLWARFDPDARRTVLAHEIAHFARRDHWVRWLELAAAALYWWHPAVWIARREIRRTEDAACDAWVVWAFPECARKYGAALVETVDFLAAARPPALLPGSGIGEAGGLKRRLTRIVRGTAPRALSRAGWLVVILAAAAALPFAPGRAEEKPVERTSKAPKVLPGKPDLKGQKVTANSTHGWAAVALAAIDPKCEAAPADVVVKALAEAIHYRGDNDIRLAALDALGALGPLAKSAVPALEGKLTDPYVGGVARTTTKRKVRQPAPDLEREKAAAALKKIRGE